MSTFEENLARKVIERARVVVPDLLSREADLRAEVSLYDSPLYPAFEEGMERELVSTVLALIEAEDYAETRALQRIAQHLREKIRRPERARDELREVLNDIAAERESLRTAAGISGEGAAAPNGR